MVQAGALLGLHHLLLRQRKKVSLNKEIPTMPH